MMLRWNGANSALAAMPDAGWIRSCVAVESRPCETRICGRCDAASKKSSQSSIAIQLARVSC